MSRIKLVLKIIFSYILTGFLNLGFLGMYVILTKDYPHPEDFSLVSTIFLWPISSFSSAKQILGKDQTEVWNWFNLSTILLFLCLTTALIKKKGAN